jgi:hypothetical protein
LNPSYKLGKPSFLRENTVISKNDYNKYLIRRNIEGLTKQWHGQRRVWLQKKLNFVNSKVDEDKTLNYCEMLKAEKSVVYLKKQIYQIRQFI